tara:strand:+ start:67 stop:537 length:471 start_codon:yes stop_codon:yes gene_type:complete
MKDPRKSDVDAKAAYSEYLKLGGYTDVKVIASPADISAKKNGQKYFFEIKKTTRKNIYFGASTITEWEGAFNNRGKYFFVIAKSLEDGGWEFTRYKPEDLMKFSTIPPMHLYFNVPLTDEEKLKKRSHKTAIVATEARIQKIINFYKEMKNDTLKD